MDLRDSHPYGVDKQFYSPGCQPRLTDLPRNDASPSAIASWLSRSQEHPLQVVLHHHRLEPRLIQDALEDVGVVVHAADDALDEGVGEHELEVLDGVGAGLGDELLVAEPGRL